MPAGDVVRLRTIGSLLGQNVQFGLHFRYQTTGASASDLAASWEANIMDLVKAATSASCNYTTIMVADTDPNGAETAELTLTQPNPGGVAGDVLPPQCAAVISLRTGQKGRRRRGRFYVPGLVETYQQDGRLIGAQLTSLQALAQGIINFYGDTGSETDYRACVWSPQNLEATPPRPGDLATILRTAQVDTVVRTQRRRSLGVGS